MKVFVVKQVYGGSFSNAYDLIAFENYQDGLNYVDAKNKEVNELRSKYQECEFIALEIINGLFLSHLKETDEEEYQKLGCGDFSTITEEFWCEYNKKLNEFLDDWDVVEEAMVKQNVSDTHKKMVRIYMDYHSFGEEGLPYYHVSMSPIEVVEQKESVEQ